MGLLNWFSGKKVDKLPYYQWGENGKITRNIAEVESGALCDNKLNRAYHSIPDFKMRDHIKGGLVLLVWQRDAFPKNPFRQLDDVRERQLKDINMIAGEAGKTAKHQMIDERHREKLLNMFTTLGYAFGITILIVLAFVIWKSGGINIGG